MSVRVAIKDDLAVVTIDNPPVNAASRAVRLGLIAALRETEANDDVRAVVLRAEGRTFTVGADVREFDQPPMEPHLPDVVAQLETATKPWVAALHGTVMGGGLEIALGCRYRVAASATKFGFPEVNLGLIPGAGGTVLLPRLVSPLDALTMIVGGKPIDGKRALDIGLIDQLSDADLDNDAIALARDVKQRPLPWPLSARAPKPTPENWEDVKAKLHKKSDRLEAPKHAIKAVQAALDLPANTAWSQERAAFLALKNDPQSGALRHMFFAERACGQLPGLKGVAENEVTQAGVIGGGTMGVGIAAALLLAGLPVVLIERDDAALAAGLNRVRSILGGSLKRGLLDQAKHDELSAALSGATDYSALAGMSLVIEAVFEDMEVKVDVIGNIERVVSSETVIASNTSYLDLNLLAARAQKPERIIGLHFFSPAHIMKLLEVVIPDTTAPKVTARAFALAKRLRKIAVPSGVCDGFIGNRIMSAYRRELEFLVEDGAALQDVDAAMRDYGFPMGLFEMQDLAGLDISWAMRKRQAATRDPNARYFSVGDRLCEAGQFGRKSGGGWYEYIGKSATPSKVAAHFLEDARAAKGITPKPVSADQIIAVLLNAIYAEARLILDEGIARSADDIDVVMVNGYGFPRWRGGPIYARGLRDDEIA